MATVRKLTKKQQDYARYRAEGYGYADASIKAGYCSKMKKSNIYRDAIRREYTSYSAAAIQAEIKRLQEAADQNTILNRQQRQVMLTEIALDHEEKTDNRLRAADMLNRMGGDYTDVVRTNVTGGVELTYEERKRLIEEELQE